MSDNKQNPGGKVPNLFETFLVGWGMFFRAIFIISIGIFVWLYIEPQSLMNIPFAELTLGHLFRNLMALLVVIGILGWLFNPPQREPDGDNPYGLWVGLSVIVILVVLGMIGTWK